MHNYKQLYLSLLEAASRAITAMDRLDFGSAKELLIKAQQEAEEQWLREESENAS